MFDTLNDKLEKIVRSIKGRAVISESDIEATMREIRIALLEADVALSVVKQFIEPGKNNASDDDDPFEVSDADTILNYIKGK